MKPLSTFWSLLFLQLLFPLSLVAQDSNLAIPANVDSLIQVSRAHTAEAEFDQAFAISAAAGQLAEECCGKNSAAFASYCFNEGRIRYFMGRNKEAIPWYVLSKEIRAKVLGTQHVDYGKSLNNLAIVYDVMGRYEAAEPLYLEALKVREVTAGRESVTYANALHNLSGLYNQMGEYEASEIMGVQALATRERLLGKEHPEYANSLNNLANLYYLTNNFSRAKQLYLEAKAICETQEDTDTENYIAVLDNLGALFLQINEFELSEDYYHQAANLRSNLLGEAHPDYALSLNHLAVVYRYTSRLAKAEEMILQALGILEDAGQKDLLDYGLYLQNLSDIYTVQGKVAIARDVQLQSLEILAAQLNKSHPRYLRGLRDLATNEQTLGELETSAAHLRELGKLEEKTLFSAVRHLSEEELANFTEDFKENLHRYCALAEKNPALADLCYNKILVYKGFLQNTALQLNQIVQADSISNDQYQQLRALHRQLAAMYTSSYDEQEELTALEIEANELEKILVRQRAALGNALRQVSWQQVQGELQAEEAAIEYIHYERPPYDGRKNTYYAALLLLPDVSQPLFIPLVGEIQLNEFLRNEGQPTADFINTLYDKKGKGRELYAMTWEPIAAALAKYPDVQRIHYSASGLFHRINLGAIPMPDGRTLSQQYHLLAKGSTRQLVTHHDKPTVNTPRSAHLYGGIDYGVTSTEINSSDTKTSGIRAAARMNYHQQRGYQADDGYWQTLPWTEVEVMTAKDYLEEANYTTSLLMEQEATETSLKKVGEQGAAQPYYTWLPTASSFPTLMS